MLSRKSFNETLREEWCIVQGLGRIRKGYPIKPCSLTEAEAKLKEFFIAVEIIEDSTKVRVWKRLLYLFDSHFYSHYRTSGGYEKQLAMYSRWENAASVIRDLLDDTNEWYAKSDNIKKLLKYLKDLNKEAAKERAKLISSYGKNNQAKSEMIKELGGFAFFILKHSPSKSQKHIFPSVVMLLNGIYPGIFPRELSDRKKIETLAAYFRQFRKKHGE